MKITYTTTVITEFDDDIVDDCVYDMDNPLNKENIISNEIKSALEFVNIKVLSIETRGHNVYN